METNLGDKLVEELEQWSPKEFKVVVMPHFCVDSSLNPGGDYNSFMGELEVIRKQGGGNIVVDQSIGIGGKASNCALALSSLGLDAYLIVRTSELGYKLLQHFTEGKVDISHVSRNGKLAITTAIELHGSNIMLSDPGSLSSFGPHYLSSNDEKLIQEADMVCISDWGLNDRGTELAKHVFEIVKQGKGKGRGKTYFDPGDPSPKAGMEEEISRLVEILKRGLVDVLGVNEDELLRYGQTDDSQKAVNSLRKITRVDLHTKDHVASFQKDSESKVPTFNVKPLRLTGAGDAWNAGNILGDVMGLNDKLRLTLANAVAAYYVSHSQGKHPGVKDLMEFLEKSGF